MKNNYTHTDDYTINVRIEKRDYERYKDACARNGIGRGMKRSLLDHNSEIFLNAINEWSEKHGSKRHI